MKVISHPSLALIKYWGKDCDALNTPATPSLGVNLKAFVTETTITLAEKDSVTLQGKPAHITRYCPFFDEVRKRFCTNAHFNVDSTNNFPTAAGLASSSSGFAALAYGAAKLIDKDAPLSLISELARVGSASSARAVFPGFVIFKEKALSAEPLYPETYWEDLRVLIAIISQQEKPLSSREAMRLTKETSPCYPAWLNSAKDLFNRALIALKEKDLKTLGNLMRESTYLMFATMISAKPPILYWRGETCAIIQSLETLRKQGFSVFETCDAGPQVKMFVEAKDLSSLEQELKRLHPEITCITSTIAGGVHEA